MHVVTYIHFWGNEGYQRRGRVHLTVPDPSPINLIFYSPFRYVRLTVQGSQLHAILPKPNSAPWLPFPGYVVVFNDTHVRVQNSQWIKVLSFLTAVTVAYLACPIFRIRLRYFRQSIHRVRCAAVGLLSTSPRCRTMVAVPLYVPLIISSTRELNKTTTSTMGYGRNYYPVRPGNRYRKRYGKNFVAGQ